MIKWYLTYSIDSKLYIKPYHWQIGFFSRKMNEAGWFNHIIKKWLNIINKKINI